MNAMNLLSLEWKKFKNNSVFNLFGVMYLVTYPVVIFIGKELQLPAMVLDTNDFFMFPNNWQWMAYVGNWLVFFFLGFIMMNMITSEVGFKTMRQNIITGMTRKDYFLGKLYTAIAISLATTLYYIICTVAIGFFHNDPYSFANAFDEPIWIFRFFLMSMGYLSFALLIGFVIRRSGVAIFTYTCYILFIELMLKWFVHGKVVSNSSSINYWPLNAIEDLAPLPSWNKLENVPMKDIDFAFLLTPSHAMIASSIYICLFIGLAYWHFMKKDI